MTKIVLQKQGGERKTHTERERQRQRQTERERERDTERDHWKIQDLRVDEGLLFKKVFSALGTETH